MKHIINQKRFYCFRVKAIESFLIGKKVHQQGNKG